MKMTLAVLALVISSLSLALQLTGQKRVPPLQQFMVPARLNELEHRLERADVLLIRESIVMRHGIGLPFIREISNDYQRIIVRALVSEENLPKTYDERKEALLETATMSVAVVNSAFDLKLPSAINVVTVQFMSITDMAKEANTDKIYAEFRGGELTFH